MKIKEISNEHEQKRPAICNQPKIDLEIKKNIHEKRINEFHHPNMIERKKIQQEKV